MYRNTHSLKSKYRIRLRQVARISGRWWQFATRPGIRNRYTHIGWELVPIVSGGANYTVLQSAKGQLTTASGTAGPTATFVTANISAGSKLVAIVSASTPFGDYTAVGSANTACTRMGGIALSGSVGWCDVWAADFAAGDIGTKPQVTTTFPTSGAGDLIILEVSGLVSGNTTAMLDGTLASVTANNNTGVGIPPSYTSTATGEFLISVYGDDGGPITWAKTASYTLVTDNYNSDSISDCVVVYKNSTNGLEGAGYTISGTAVGWANLMVAFKVSAPASKPFVSKVFPHLLVKPLKTSSGIIEKNLALQKLAWAWGIDGPQPYPPIFPVAPVAGPTSTYIPPYILPYQIPHLGPLGGGGVLLNQELFASFPKPPIIPQGLRNLFLTAFDQLSLLTDVANENVSLPRTVSDTIGALSDSAVRNIMNFQRTASDSLGAISDTAIRNIMAFLRTASDTLSALSDSAVRVMTQPRTASDTLGAISDSAVRGVMSFSRTASDTLSAITDSAIRNVMTFLRTASDTLGSITETAIEKVALPRTASDSLVGITESVVAQKGISRTAADSLSAISDSAIRNVMSFQRTASDSLSAISDSAIRNIQNFIRTASDTLGGITESILSQKGISRTASDTISAISDSAARGATTLQRTASDSLASISDTAIRNVQSFIRTASDSILALSDSAIRSGITLSRTASDVLASISDSATRKIALQRVVSDTISAISDVNVRNPQGFIRTAIDVLNSILDSAGLPPKFFIVMTQTIYTRDGVRLIATRDGVQKIYTRDGKFTVKEG